MGIDMKSFKIIFTTLLLAITLTSYPVEAEAQCPMCRMSAESNLKAGGTAGKGLNKGILYMLSMPYLLVGSIGLIWYLNRKSDEESMEYPDLTENQLN